MSFKKNNEQLVNEGSSCLDEIAGRGSRESGDTKYREMRVLTWVPGVPRDSFTNDFSEPQAIDLENKTKHSIRGLIFSKTC